MDPTPMELGAMTNIGQVCEWTGMDAAVIALFCNHLGLQSNGPVRRLAAVMEEDIVEAKGTIKRGDEALRPGVKAMLGEAWRIARIVAKVTKSSAEEAADKEKQDKFEQEKLVVLRAQAEAKQAEVAALKVQDATDTVKLSEVVDQVSTLVAPLLSLEDINAAHAKYKEKQEGECPKDERCTDEQLSCLMHLFRKKLNVNVDLAIFGPYANRMRRKMILSGLILGADGSFNKVEFKGPPTIEVWMAGFLVFKSGVISCDILGANPLDIHMKRIAKFHRDYGSKTWHLLYQAECRFRAEELPDIRRQLLEEKNEVEKSGGTHPFNKEDPWRMVWARAVSKDMDHFWQEEFVTPAMMVRFHLKSEGDVVDGDAPIDPVPTRAASSTTPAATTIIGTSYETDPIPYVNPGKRPGTSGERERNKKKKALCPWFYNDECGESPKGTVECPYDSALRHQCSKCLGPHPTIWCGQGKGKGEEKSGKAKKGKGRGKGKGKGKSRGGGKGWWQQQ